MKKNTKIIVALVAVLAVATFAFLALSPAEPEKSVVEDVRTLDFNEAESLDLVGPGNEIANIEEDIKALDGELESVSKELFDELDAELNQL